MPINLLKEIALFQNKSNNFIYILECFNSKINYLSYKLEYPEAKTDFIIYLYELLKLINNKKFENDKDILMYINKCLENKSIALFNKNVKAKGLISFTSETELLDLINHEENNNEYSDIIFNDLISLLKPRQKQIMFYKFYLQLSDIEIAKILKISRQAINKSEKVAFKILKTELCKEGCYV